MVCGLKKYPLKLNFRIARWMTYLGYSEFYQDERLYVRRDGYNFMFLLTATDQRLFCESKVGPVAVEH